VIAAYTAKEPENPLARFATELRRLADGDSGRPIHSLNQK
jgi:hypothetical protein